MSSNNEVQRQDTAQSVNGLGGCDEEENVFFDIEELQAQGISAADISKLRAAGIATVQSVNSSTKRFLGRIKGFSEIKVDKIKDAASKIVKTTFTTAKEIARNRERVVFISTGSKALDAVLGGGISTGSITEIYGEWRAGKTQLPVEMGGGNGRCAFVDTEGTFRPDRIRSIARRFKLDEEEALANIIVGRALNSDHQMDLIIELATKFAEDGQYRLLIIDSIMALFRIDYSGRGELSERQQRLNQMLGKLTRVAEEFQVAVLLVNQVQSDPGGGMAFAAAEKKPLGGHVLAHASATRVYLRKGRGDERVGKVVDSPDVAESEASYRITEGGIDDVA